jgi:ankyrin repeat protein
MKRVFSSIVLLLALSFLFVSNARAGEREDNLVMLAMSGSVDGVRDLLDQGVNVNAKDHFIGCTALVGAAQYDKADVVQLLLARGADINALGYGFTALTMAALNGNADVVRILIDKGADVNKKDEMGDTPLMKANKVLREGHRTGIDSKTHRTLFTPLTPAETKTYTSIVQMLQESGAK